MRTCRPARVTSTYFVLIGCRHSELGRIDRELHCMYVRCERGLSTANYHKSVLSLVPRLSTRRYPHLLLSAGACSRYRSIAGTLRPQLSIDLLPAARRCCCRSTGQTDDGRTPDRYVDPAPHTRREALISSELDVFCHYAT